MTYWILLCINFLIKLLCLVAGIGLLGKKSSKPFRYLGGYLITGFVSELFAFLLAYYKRDNMPIFYSFVPLMFVLVMLFLESSNKRIAKKHVSIWLSIVLIGSSLFSYYYMNDFENPNAITCLVGSMAVIVASVDTIITYSINYTKSDDMKLILNILYILLFYSLGTLSVWIFFGVFTPGHYPKSLHKTVFYSLYIITNTSYLLLGLLLFPQKKIKHP